MKVVLLLAAAVWIALVIRQHRSVGRSTGWIAAGRCALCGVALGSNHQVVNGRSVCRVCADPYKRELARVRYGLIAILIFIAVVCASVGLVQIRKREADATITLGFAAAFGSVVAAHFIIERRRARR